MSGRSPSRWNRIAGGEVGVAAEAADGDAFDFLDAFDSFPSVNAIIHGIAEPAEHDEIQRRRRDHHLRREHADLCVARCQRSGGGDGPLDKNQLDLIAVLFEQLRFLGYPQRRELTDLAGPHDVDVCRDGRYRVEQKQSREKTQATNNELFSFVILSLENTKTYVDLCFPLTPILPNKR